MSNFLDGPAKGVELTLGRSPLFLRVVRSKEGIWDALDQLDDKPERDEDVFVYRCITSTPTVAHIDGRDPKTGRRFGKWISIADYILNEEQPNDQTIRDNELWAIWCESLYNKLKQ